MTGLFGGDYWLPPRISYGPPVVEDKTANEGDESSASKGVCLFTPKWGLILDVDRDTKVRICTDVKGECRFGATTYLD